MSAPIPEWAIDLAHQLANAEVSNPRAVSTYSCHHLALARYIALNEEPPVDPLLIEARRVACGYISAPMDEVLEGGFDSTHVVNVALAGLKRGIELGEANRG